MVYLEINNIYKTYGQGENTTDVLSNSNLSIEEGEFVAIVGFTGSGKTTLVNTLDPNLNLRVGEISSAHEQGKHTTTFSEMHALNSGGFIIDTPGIKGFGLIDIDKSELSNYFSEFRLIKHDCKFNNCLHQNEPNCAVKNGLNNGQISKSRYKNYLSMMVDENKNYRTDFWN